MFRRAAVSSRLAVTTPLTGVTSLRILLPIGVVQRDRSKRSSHWGIDLFEESWSFDMKKHDRCVSIDRVGIVRWNAVSFFYLIFCLSRFWQNNFLLCTAFIGQCVCMFHPVSDEHRSNQALITYVYINIFVYNIRSVLGITMIDVRKLACAYLRTDN